VRVGYTVIDAINGVEALAGADSYPGGIDLLLTDSMMPEMGGAELVVHLRERRNGIRVLMMSGYTEGIGLEPELNQTERFIEKPFSTADLLVAIRSALRAGNNQSAPR
jgi:CheY-like chemotaxis protein